MGERALGKRSDMLKRQYTERNGDFRSSLPSELQIVSHLVQIETATLVAKFGIADNPDAKLICFRSLHPISFLNRAHDSQTDFSTMAINQSLMEVFRLIHLLQVQSAA
jgi:hypothetical protein